MITDTLSAPELRRFAMKCRARASAPGCPASERELLIKMQVALLALADNADWLAGRARPRPGPDETRPRSAA